MNFRHMFYRNAEYGFPLALLAMAALVTGMWIFLRRSGWL